MRQVALRKAVQLANLGWSDDPSGRGQSAFCSEVQLRGSWLNRIYPGFRGVGGSETVCGLESEVRSVNNIRQLRYADNTCYETRRRSRRGNNKHNKHKVGTTSVKRAARSRYFNLNSSVDSKKAGTHVGKRSKMSHSSQLKPSKVKK